MKLLRFTSKFLSIALVTLLFIKVSQEAAFPPGSSSGVENVSESEDKAIEVTGEPSFSSSETMTCTITKRKGQLELWNHVVTPFIVPVQITGFKPKVHVLIAEVNMVLGNLNTRRTQQPIKSMDKEVHYLCHTPLRKSTGFKG
ncbi:hypothetical protein PGTUg99_036501 [Puccinia graminis f. sp. tritici]|uniref:Uncharacterized protein n=1 Tax=Puccinia graminis f. sp. tritici TaxID=56615 RepID=A0A5B0N4P2_PUCGR|nr:hypothetical protein PGTUg99_036488 [Puccinia graminis f. sp. tritici]KAA1083586.1 hypothetical protein PGTUg99_036501 [Puccinia graminis f. sp. tritici]